MALGRILFVEDEEALRESLTRVLSREGYEVDAVESAEEGLSLLAERSYDLLLTDIILPGMSGMALLRKCRQEYPALLVIIITAYATIESAVEAIKAGSYGYLVKPIIHEELKENVRKALATGNAGKG